jgi:hypothetical protein
VVVDTFTVANPWNFYATAVTASSSITNPYTFDILHTVHEEVNHNLYVAPWGDNANSGLSPAEPMQSIFMAMYRIASDPEDPKTVYVADGHYSTSLNNQLFPIPIKSYTSLVGESREGTILDAEGDYNNISLSAHSQVWRAQNLSLINAKKGVFVRRSSNFQISEVSISNIYDIGNSSSGIRGSYAMGIVEITNVDITNVSSSDSAAGFMVLQASESLKLHNVEISDCEAPQFDAITISAVDECDVILDGCEVHDNRSSTTDVLGFNTMFQISPSL